MSDCQRCRRRKSYQDCYKRAWFAPSDIRYCSAQIFWLIKNLMLLHLEAYPINHKDTGYIGNSNKKSGHHAPFEMPSMIAATLEHRLEACGTDGLILEFIALLDEGGDRVAIENKLAHYFRATIEDIDARFHYALKYCCGYREREKSYSQFINYTKHREQKSRGRDYSLPHNIH